MKSGPEAKASADKTTAKSDKGAANTLMLRPGFLIRRLYQIHISIFVEECAAETITPVQYSVLANLDECGAIDQAALSRAVALERTSLADIVTRLARRQMVLRRTSPDDRRMVLCELTTQGRAVLERLKTASARAHERTISSLPKNERLFFLKALKRLIDAQDDRQEP